MSRALWKMTAFVSRAMNFGGLLLPDGVVVGDDAAVAEKVAFLCEPERSRLSSVAEEMTPSRAETACGCRKVCHPYATCLF